MRRLAALALSALVAAACLGAPGASAANAPTRLLVVKVDGLSQELADRFASRIDARTGRPALPWIRRLFYERGVRFENFYARGISLSEPSWAILDTGQHSLVKGNFEVDRRTGRSSDHLNTVALYYEVSRLRRVYPDAVEALDDAGIPLLSDAFQFERRETGIQLLRRGTKFFDFLEVGLGPVKGPLLERIGDLVVGVDFKKSYVDATRKSFLAAVRDPSQLYVDMYFPSLDAALHDDASEETLVAELQLLDQLLGEAHAALVESGTADRAVLCVVSDHGQTYDPGGAFSQGVNLVGYLARPELGAHHVLSRSRPRSSYEMEGSLVKPSIPGAAVSPSPHSIYLADRPDQVTCAFDFDGNERAQMHFRDPDLNRLQMLVRALRSAAPAAGREAAAAAALEIVARRRAGWSAEAATLREELAALEARAAEWRQELELRRRWVDQRAAAAARGEAPDLDPLPPFAGLSKLNLADRDKDVGHRVRELKVRLLRVEQDLAEYGAYAASLELRAAIRTPADLLAAPEERLFGPRDLGAPLSIYDLVAYPVGLGRSAADRGGPPSFATVDYLRALTSLRVRNSVRADLGTRPVAFVAAALPLEEARRALVASGAVSAGEAAGISTALLVYESETSQLIVAARGAGAEAELLVVPGSGFRADPTTRAIAFERSPWRPGLPLRLFEDPGLATAGEGRDAWLSRFHRDREWLEAAHATENGLAVVGLAETFQRSYRDAFERAAARATSAAERLRLRFELRRREAMETDLFVAAAPSWNFDHKDFNPCGNHGGFHRASMHAVLWLNGGAATRVRPGPAVVAAPYDGLDFVPTIFEVAGVSRDGRLPDEYAKVGFGPYPGRVAWEALETAGPAAP